MEKENKMEKSEKLCSYIDKLKQSGEIIANEEMQNELVPIYKTSILLKNILGKYTEAPIHLRESTNRKLRMIADKRATALGEVVEEQRRKRGLDIKKLAETLGVGPEVFLNIKHGLRLPRTVNFNLIASAIGMSQEELASSTKEKFSSKEE